MIPNTFYAVIERQNMLRDRILNFFLAFCSYPRLIIEVFIRKDFGERYFRLFSAITVAAILYVLPYFFDWISNMTEAVSKFNGSQAMRRDMFSTASHTTSTISPYLSWYIFIAVFLGFSIKHHLDIKKNPSAIEGKKYSLYTGTINPVFYKVKLSGIQTNTRFVEQFVEPFLFFIAGVVLWLIGQKLGNLLIVCSIFYCVSYVGIYIAADNAVMDMIDNVIINQQMKASFMENKPKEETAGFEFVGRKPVDPELRQQLLKIMMSEDKAVPIR